MSPRICVDLSQSLWQGELAGRGLENCRICEKGSPLQDRGEFLRELAINACRGALLHQGDGRHVPEEGGSAVAKGNLISGGKVVEGGEFLADRGDHMADRWLAMGGTHH